MSNVHSRCAKNQFEGKFCLPLFFISFRHWTKNFRAFGENFQVILWKLHSTCSGIFLRDFLSDKKSFFFQIVEELLLEKPKWQTTCPKKDFEEDYFFWKVPKHFWTLKRILLCLYLEVLDRVVKFSFYVSVEFFWGIFFPKIFVFWSSLDFSKNFSAVRRNFSVKDVKTSF